MHILVTNDDGVHAPGLLALAQALRKLGDVTVLAPDKNWSASGHVKTLNRPLRVNEVTLADGSVALVSDGAPSDCVALALLGFVARKIDVVVSGINPHANLGHDVTYSGTVTAAMEAAIAGLPGVAVSLDSPVGFKGAVDYTAAALVARQVVERLVVGNEASNLLLNVNVPFVTLDALQGWMFTRQGQRVYHDELVRRMDPQNRPYYWIGGKAPTGVADQGTDIGALAAGCVSVTPLKLDLTDSTQRAALEQRWFNTN